MPASRKAKKKAAKRAKKAAANDKAAESGISAAQAVFAKVLEKADAKPQ